MSMFVSFDVAARSAMYVCSMYSVEERAINADIFIFDVAEGSSDCRYI